MVDNSPNVSQAKKQWCNWSKKQARSSTSGADGYNDSGSFFHGTRTEQTVAGCFIFWLQINADRLRLIKAQIGKCSQPDVYIDRKMT